MNKKRLSYKEKLMIKCRHFNGMQNQKCAVGIKYPEYKEVPCFGENVCTKYSPLTENEAQKECDASSKNDELIAKGLSICCEKPLDTTQVITEGPHKGHGPRFCSACEKLVFMV